MVNEPTATLISVIPTSCSSFLAKTKKWTERRSCLGLPQSRLKSNVSHSVVDLAHGAKLKGIKMIRYCLMRSIYVWDDQALVSLKVLISNGLSWISVAASDTRLAVLFILLLMFSEMSSISCPAVLTISSLVVFYSFQVICLAFQSFSNWLAAKVNSVRVHPLSRLKVFYIDIGSYWLEAVHVVNSEQVATVFERAKV